VHFRLDPALSKIKAVQAGAECSMPDAQCAVRTVENGAVRELFSALQDFPVGRSRARATGAALIAS
jgi:hypothetical protein